LQEPTSLPQAGAVPRTLWGPGVGGPAGVGEHGGRV